MRNIIWVWPKFFVGHEQFRKSVFNKKTLNLLRNKKNFTNVAFALALTNVTLAFDDGKQVVPVTSSLFFSCWIFWKGTSTHTVDVARYHKNCQKGSKKSYDL